jgi:hypothetical protein
VSPTSTTANKPRRRTAEEKYLAFARRPKRAGSSSRYRGVSFRQQTQRWIAQVYWRGRRYFLGSYEREEEAAAAYNRHAARIIGSLAVLNELPAGAIPPDQLCADAHTASGSTPDSGEAT